MKTIIKTSFAILGLLFAKPSFAQDIRSGIYLTDSAFVNNQLTLAIDCKTEKHKIKLNDFFNKPFIEVIHEGKSYKYNKKDIFGFRTCDGKDFRFVNNDHYEILSKDVITIYTITAMVNIPGAKLPQEVSKYFFSINYKSALTPLTLLNLKKEFPTNHKFHDSLDMQFKSDDELVMYDSFHKKYKVNHLLEESLKTN